MVKTLLDEGRYCSIATHDPKTVERVLALLNQKHIPKSKYEFEMLYGIGTELLNTLKQQEHHCRQYIVYGKEWYLLLFMRVEKNPENIFKVLVDIMSDLQG